MIQIVSTIFIVRKRNSIFGNCKWNIIWCTQSWWVILLQSLFQNSIDIFYLFNNPHINSEATFSFSLFKPVSIPK